MGKFDRRTDDIEDELFAGSATQRREAKRDAQIAAHERRNAAYERQMEIIRQANAADSGNNN